MRIYVASSWRNTRQQHVVGVLRGAGHEVYDFRYPAPGVSGFAWRQCVDDQAALRDPGRFAREVLSRPVARAGFDHDMQALRAAEATVLALPCGRSAHLELGWAAGRGQRTIVLLDDPMTEPELMYLMCSAICAGETEVLAALGAPPHTFAEERYALPGSAFCGAAGAP